MTEEEWITKNRRVALAVGYTDVVRFFFLNPGASKTALNGILPGAKRRSRVPTYHEDLQAAVDAAKKLGMNGTVFIQEGGTECALKIDRGGYHNQKADTESQAVVLAICAVLNATESI